jgi:hypothetical protein
MRRTLGRSVFWLGLFIWLAGAATAANADATYDYIGSNFTSIMPGFCPTGTLCTPLYTTGDSVTGDVVLANPLPPSVAGGTNYENGGIYFVGEAINQSFVFTDQVLSFSFTDGVNTITSDQNIGGGASV